MTLRLKIIIILLIGFNAIINSQTDKLSSEAQSIKTAYENLIKEPNNKQFQKRYIIAFPENSEIFKKVFHSAAFDQLYLESHLYIFKLAELSKNFPDLAGDKLIRLCIGLRKWDADAVGYIQHVTMGYANSNYMDFIGLIEKLNQEELETLVTFLADVENHTAYNDYQDFMVKLKSNNESKLYALFEKAKDIRITQKDHGIE